MAILSDSVPPLVKITSSGFAPIKDATCALADSISFLASLPSEYRVDAFPKEFTK